jgi:hypothetical protein
MEHPTNSLRARNLHGALLIFVFLFILWLLLPALDEAVLLRLLLAALQSS